MVITFDLSNLPIPIFTLSVTLTVIPTLTTKWFADTTSKDTAGQQPILTHYKSLTL